METSPPAGRIQLEPLVVAHARELFPVLADPLIYRYIPDEPPGSIAVVEARCRRLESRRSPDGSQQWLNWAIRRVADLQCVGYVQATVYTDKTAALAFVLGSEFWGMGLAHEASLAALRLLFGEHDVTRAFATADGQNVRSLKLLSQLGFARIEPAAYPHGALSPGDQAFQLDPEGIS